MGALFKAFKRGGERGDGEQDVRNGECLPISLTFLHIEHNFALRFLDFFSEKRKVNVTVCTLTFLKVQLLYFESLKYTFLLDTVYFFGQCTFKK